MSISFDFVSFTITQDEGEPFWRCSIQLSRPQDAIEFKPTDSFEVNLMGELFSFYVESVTINRTSPVGVTASVEGVGLGADLQPPRCDTLSKLWDVDVQAFDVVNELLEGRVDSWNMVNWTIPGNRLSIDMGSRVDLAKSVVEAAGGVLESLPNGLFTVRKKFPLSPLQYGTQPPDLIIDEVVDIESVTFNYQNAQYVDWVRIRDIDDSGVSDTVEMVFDKNTQLAGTLRVYPHPWRKVHLEHTGPTNIQLDLIGEVVRTVPDPADDPSEELLSIFEGTGTTQFPVEDFQTIRWQARDLISLYHDPHSTTIYSSHPTEKNTLAYVTYTCRSINYRTGSPISQDVQFLVVED